jgi:hypothetical protein
LLLLAQLAFEEGAERAKEFVFIDGVGVGGRRCRDEGAEGVVEEAPQEEEDQKVVAAFRAHGDPS